MQGWVIETRENVIDKEIELSLTVPITNSLAFLFTVLGDWWVDRKLINRGKIHQYIVNNFADQGRYLDRDGSLIGWNSVMRTKQD